MTNNTFSDMSGFMKAWSDRIQTDSPTLFPPGAAPLQSIQVGLGRVTLLIGPLGVTAAAMQLTFDWMLQDPGLRVCICHGRLGLPTLLERQLARLTGIPLEVIRDHQGRPRDPLKIRPAVEKLVGLGRRLSFVSSPAKFDQVVAKVQRFRPHLLVLDPMRPLLAGGIAGAGHGFVDVRHENLRLLADRGIAVLAVSPTGRTRFDPKREPYGPSLQYLNVFGESSDLDFADDRYFLLPDLKVGGIGLNPISVRDGYSKKITAERMAAFVANQEAPFLLANDAPPPSRRTQPPASRPSRRR